MYLTVIIGIVFLYMRSTITNVTEAILNKTPVGLKEVLMQNKY